MRNLGDLKTGQKATVFGINMPDVKKRRIIDLGIIPETQIEALFTSPLCDPTAYMVRGSVIAIRSEDAKRIYIL